ncbi:MAG TPA: CHAD domain-containing protein, partial [Terriglobales bacterium]|nr:CHAD domain-containing protein [Terriglobales bacterium]
MKNEIKQDKLGLAHWMQQVVVECQRASLDFSADSVHDLRVALRRVRSLAAVLQCVDPHPAWKRMRRAGKVVFAALGELRDVQVMIQWVQELFPPDEATAIAVLGFISGREVVLKREAAAALAEFDQEEWAKWSELLPSRALPIAECKVILDHLALEHWIHAHELHRRALQNRSRTSYHNLRIGIKKLRYMIENFLPDLNQDFGKELKHFQDVLGEIHDLDVLWAAAIEINKFPDIKAKIAWRDLIDRQRGERIAKYRARMVGANSLWRVWRARLPDGEYLERGSLERLKMWASFLDPEFQNSSRVSRLALQLYDGLVGNGTFKTNANLPGRTLLEAAAVMRDVGRVKRERKHQKSSYKLIRKLDLPLGWREKDLEMAALIARYHRGAL